MEYMIGINRAKLSFVNNTQIEYLAMCIRIASLTVYSLLFDNC